jgi:hypothetical protein
LSYQFKSGYCPRTFIDGQVRPNNFADCAVWITFCAHALVMELGDLSLLDRVVPFTDGEEASVFEHLRRAVQYLYDFKGHHDLVRIWGGDWHDSMCLAGLEGKGVSVWLSIAWVRANDMLVELCRLLGKEEQDIIAPAIKEAYEGGTLAFGPFAADGFFAAGTFKKYDAVLAMYHDQGLAPFKTLTPYGVNVTTNLEVVRTSPDHGVGYDIAGKGVADESSMRNAIYMALDIYRSREREAEYAANPLKHIVRERGGRDRDAKDIKELKVEN